MVTSNCKVLVLGRESLSTKIIIHFLVQKYDVTWIAEQRDDKFLIIKKRIKNIGYFKVISQLLFFVLRKFIYLLSKKRLNELTYFLKGNRIKPVEIVSNVNKYWEYLDVKQLKYSIIVISGTRIINEDFLTALGDTPMINIHTGIVPKYRGVHGGYWALASRDKKNFGVTIHCIDKGIDTGRVIKKIFLEISDKDNYCSYPILQVVAAAKALINEIPRIIANDFCSFTNNKGETTKLWTHPTIWQYIYNYMTRSVK
ncbi:formyl transferase [Amylibacter sp.]|nr:formyl transferase [Amylibacter sp.]